MYCEGNDKAKAHWIGRGDKKAYSRSQIKEHFGLTEKMIDVYLGEPNVYIARRPNPSFYGFAVCHVEEVLKSQELSQAMEDMEKRRENRKKAETLDVNDDNIAEALYIINKSAKKSRDTKQRAYWEKEHRVCRVAKTRSQNLYKLKNAVLQNLIIEGVCCKIKM